jgi:hypothetical protein
MNKDEFLRTIVLGWIKRDVERMKDEVPVRPGQPGNINFFLALCVLISMEFLGGFLFGQDRKFENVKEYINKCFSDAGEYPIEILKDIYRNGLAHDFFPRGAVSRANEHPPIFVDSKIGIILDAETLANDFLNSLDKFKNELDETKYKQRMQQIQQKVKDQQTKHKPIIDRLPTKSATRISTSTTSVTSESPSSPPPPVSTLPPPEDENQEIS